MSVASFVFLSDVFPYFYLCPIHFFSQIAMDTCSKLELLV